MSAHTRIRNPHRIRATAAVGIAALILGLAPWRVALAYFDFEPTPTEWTAWPEYCRVQYSFIMQQRESEYANAYGRADFDALEARLQTTAFHGLHHFCAGLLWTTRARGQGDPKQRDYMLNTALNETLFSYRSAEHTSVVYPDMIMSLARIRREMGQRDQAIVVLEKGIEEQPQRLDLYGALAVIYREQKRVDQAREVLLRADQLAEGKSPEIQYNLGLINLELGRVDEAVANASRVYQRGYPLPGLKNKLQKLGKWPPPPAPEPTAGR